MATIKGQNLRILVNGHCIAAATSCTCHLAASADSITTKDSEGDWEEKQIVGLSWDMQADALVPAELEGVDYSNKDDVINLKKGDRLIANAISPKFPLIKEVGGFGYIIPYERNGNLYYIAPKDISVIPKDFNRAIVIPAASNITIAEIEAGFKVDVLFDRTKGKANSEEDVQLFKGRAIVSDISFTAGNRQQSQYSVQLTGTGELEQVKAKTSTETK